MNTKQITELKVKFLYGDSGFCRDVFKTTTGIRICRMEEKFNGIGYAGWYTLCGEDDEPDCPIKTTLPIHVIGKNKSILVTEQNTKKAGYYFSEKKFPFSWEEPEDPEMIKLHQAIYQSILINQK